MKNVPLRVLALAAALSTSAFGGVIVYSNTTFDTLDTQTFGGATELGDQIALAGTERSATLATVQFLNIGTAGTFDTTLRLFNVGSPVGSQIGSDFALTGVAAPTSNSGVFNVSFILPGLLVPDNLIFTVTATNQSAGVDVLGVNLFEPPTIGSSDNAFLIAKLDGTYITLSSTDHQNVFFELQAVPEPATIGLAGAALVGLAILRRRRAA